MLKDPNFVNFIGNSIDMYFELNKNETTASIRWEAFKAYIRGEIISYTSNKNKQYKQEIQLLEKQIKSIESEFYQDKDPKKLQNLTIMRAKYDKLTAERVARSLMWTKQAYYDQGEKAGKLLAWQIKKTQAETVIRSIKSKTGNLTLDPKEINDNFREFYELLYKSEYNGNEEVQDTFLDPLQF